MNYSFCICSTFAVVRYMACSQYLTAVVNYSFCVCSTFGGVMASRKAVVNYSFCICSTFGGVSLMV